MPFPIAGRRWVVYGWAHSAKLSVEVGPSRLRGGDASSQGFGWRRSMTVDARVLAVATGFEVTDCDLELRCAFGAADRHE